MEYLREPSTGILNYSGCPYVKEYPTQKNIIKSELAFIAEEDSETKKLRECLTEENKIKGELAFIVEEDFNPSLFEDLIFNRV
tara:strand:+ start:703 stop:951 length:249 start_codon:yes stop_codon:yes gene_type:complete